MKLQNKVVLVTGAGGGIGRELVLILLSKGARVAGVDLNPKSLAETAAAADGYKNQFEGFVTDITERSAVEALPERVLSRFGTVDGVINNAGVIQPFSRLHDLDYLVIERVFNVNLFGTLFVIKAFLPHLLKQPEAHIVNLSSMGGFLPVPGQTIYCAAKAAVKLLSEGLAAELLHTNVHVTVVFPGAVATNIMANSGVSGASTAEAPGEPSRRLRRLRPPRLSSAVSNEMHTTFSRVRTQRSWISFAGSVLVTPRAPLPTKCVRCFQANRPRGREFQRIPTQCMELDVRF